MPTKRLFMRKIKDVLRLCWGQGLSKRQAAMNCGMSRPAVDGYLRRAEAAGLCWPLPLSWMTGRWSARCFHPRRPYRIRRERRPIGQTFIGN